MIRVSLLFLCCLFTKISFSNEYILRYWGQSIGLSFDSNEDLISIGNNFNASYYTNTLDGIEIYFYDFHRLYITGGGSYKLRHCTKDTHTNSFRCDAYNGYISNELGLECRIWNYEEEVINFVKGRMWYMKFYWKTFKEPQKCSQIIFTQKETGFNKNQLFWKSMFESNVLIENRAVKFLRIDVYYGEKKE